MKKICKQFTACMLLSCMVAAASYGQDDVQKARKLRANAAYLEMKGKTAEAIAQYEESLKYHKDEALKLKVAELKGIPLSVNTAAESNGTREYAGEVYSRLDLNGDILVYLNTMNIVQPLRKQIKQLTEAVIASTETPDESMTDDVAGSIDPVLDWFGLYSVQAFGASLSPLDNALYRIKSYTMVDPTQRDRVIWRLCGGHSRDMKTLAFMPAEAELMESWLFDLGAVLPIVREGLQKFAPEGTDQMVDMQLDQARTNLGMDVAKMIESLDNEMAIAITLDPTKKITVPVSAEDVLEIPDPGILLAIKVKNDAIIQAVVQFLTMNQIPFNQQDISGTTIYSLNLPLELPVPVQPSLAIKDNVLLVSAVPGTIQSALAAYNGNNRLVDSPSFKASFAGLPEDKVSAMAYVSPAFFKTYIDVELKLMKLADIFPDAKEVQLLVAYMDKLLRSHSTDLYAAVAVTDDDGTYAAANVRTAEMNPVVSAIMSPVSMMVTMGLAAAAEQKQMAVKYECMGNLQMIMDAKATWATETNADDTAVPSWDDLIPYLPEGINLICGAGGEYNINAVNELPTCTIDGHDLTEWYGSGYSGDDESYYTEEYEEDTSSEGDTYTEDVYEEEIHEETVE